MPTAVFASLELSSSSEREASLALLPATVGSFPRSKPILAPARVRRDSKRQLLDRLLAAILMVPAAPVLAIIALLIRLTSRGPGFYSQTRVGKDGQLYTIYKLRTMYHECECDSGPRWATAGDNRITRLGRWLRNMHLDELPQLWNVIRGQMSLVGPRPERPEFVDRLQEVLPDYQRRLQVYPGLTGLAQLQLPPDTNLDSVRHKLAFDLYYVRHRGLWLDLRLLVATPFYLIGFPMTWICKRLGLPRKLALPSMIDPHRIESIQQLAG